MYGCHHLISFLLNSFQKDAVLKECLNPECWKHVCTLHHIREEKDTHFVAHNGIDIIYELVFQFRMSLNVAKGRFSLIQLTSEGCFVPKL